ncbi:MAG: hypothetical protein HF976_05785 [ANME-2 cluster archaeon]|nr:hypothetical protein [ANME-2 cluster archaeon]
MTCALLWMRSMILRPGCRGQRWGDTGVCEAAVLLLANGIIRREKQLPEVVRTAVWGRAALCLAGASCDWWGGNIEKLIRQITYC